MEAKREQIANRLDEKSKNRERSLAEQREHERRIFGSKSHHTLARAPNYGSGGNSSANNSIIEEGYGSSDQK